MFAFQKTIAKVLKLMVKGDSLINGNFYAHQAVWLLICPFIYIFSWCVCFFTFFFPFLLIFFFKQNFFFFYQDQLMQEWTHTVCSYHDCEHYTPLFELPNSYFLISLGRLGALMKAALIPLTEWIHFGWLSSYLYPANSHICCWFLSLCLISLRANWYHDCYFCLQLFPLFTE